MKLRLGFPNQSIVIEFSGEGIPRPRFLGISTSREAFSKMEANVPTEAFRVKDEAFKIGKTDDRSYAAFMAKMEAAVQATKNKSKGSKEKKRVQRVQLKSGKSILVMTSMLFRSGCTYVRTCTVLHRFRCKFFVGGESFTSVNCVGMFWTMLLYILELCEVILRCD